jgi:hypothetical protein
MLSTVTEAGRMDERLDIDIRALIREATCYLAVVDAFRAERCEPTWLPERRVERARAGRTQARSPRAPSSNTS